MNLNNSSLPQPVSLVTADGLHLVLLGILQDAIVKEVSHQLDNALQNRIPDPLDLINTSKMCSIFSISIRTLQKWVRRVPDMPQPVRICGALYWRRPDVEKFITGRKKITMKDRLGCDGKGPMDDRLK
jgi:hypothetical protein